MNARSTRGAETRLRIIRAAADLFHKQGVGATSPDQVIEASKTGKGQFFKIVKNKLAAFFLKEKAKGRLSQDANEERMADFCMATIQGAMRLGKIKRNSQTVETSAREAVAHLKRYVVAP